MQSPLSVLLFCGESTYTPGGKGKGGGKGGGGRSKTGSLQLEWRAQVNTVPNDGPQFEFFESMYKRSYHDLSSKFLWRKMYHAWSFLTSWIQNDRRIAKESSISSVLLLKPKTGKCKYLLMVNQAETRILITRHIFWSGSHQTSIWVASSFLCLYNSIYISSWSFFCKMLIMPFLITIKRGSWDFVICQDNWPCNLGFGSAYQNTIDFAFKMFVLFEPLVFLM